MRIDQVVSANATRSQKTGGPASGPLDLQDGDVLQARVVSFKDGLVQLKTPGGQTLQGEMLPGTHLEQGQSVNLQVVGRQGETLVLQIARDGQNQQAALLKGTLARMGLEPNAENLNIANLLVSRDVPLRLSTIELARNILQQYPDMSADNVAFFAANGIEPDARMIAALDRMLGGENTGGMLTAVFEQFQDDAAAQNTLGAQTAQTAQNTSSAQGVQSLLQGIADLLAQAQAQEGTANTPGMANARGAVNNATAQPPQLNAAAQALSDGGVDNTVAQSVLNTIAQAITDGAANADGAQNLLNTVAQTLADAGVNSAVSDKVLSTLAQTLADNAALTAGTESLLSTSDGLRQAAAQPPQLGAQNAANIVESLRVIAEQPAVTNEMASLTAIAAQLPEEEAAQKIQQFVQNLGDDFTPAMKQEIQTLLDTIQQSVRQTGQAEANILNAFSGRGREAVLNILDRMFARLSGGNEAAQELRGNVENSATRLLALHTAINQSGAEQAPAMARQVENIAQNMRMMDATNQYVFVQIPIMMQDRKHNAQLYVMKRESGNRKVDPENATILLALDTENLGRVESLVKIERKNVALSMRMESEDCMGFVQQHTVDLYSAVQESGFRLQDLRFMLIETPVDPVNINQVVETEYTPRKGLMDIKI